MLASASPNTLLKNNLSSPSSPSSPGDAGQVWRSRIKSVSQVLETEGIQDIFLLKIDVKYRYIITLITFDNPDEPDNPDNPIIGGR